MSLTINNKKYYTTKEIAAISRVNIRTLHRWLADGDLDHYVTAYQKRKHDPVLYRLEPPCADDVLLEGQSRIYALPQEQEDNHV